MWPPKISTLTDPPSSFLPISPRCLTNIRCRYFSLKIWVVYDQLELDWCIFDQNWATTRPLHVQIFQILIAIDRRIVNADIRLKMNWERQTTDFFAIFRTLQTILPWWWNGTGLGKPGPTKRYSAYLAIQAFEWKPGLARTWNPNKYTAFTLRAGQKCWTKDLT